MKSVNHRCPGWLRLFAIVFLSATASTLCAETIRVLVVYDSTAKTWVNSNGGMSLFAADAVAKMTQAAVNSGVNLTFELAYATDVAYTYSDFNTSLSDLKNGTGNLTAAHQLRDAYGADVVTMLVDTGSAYGTVGLGYLLTTMNGSPSYAFTVCAIRSVDQSHTLTHEVGHNLGCDHSKYQADYPGPNTDLNNYSAGWYFTGNDGKKYHTIMAYNDDGYDNYYYECPQFSSPLVTYQGVPTGSATDGDNARNIRETMGIVAGYRGEVVVPSVTLSLTGSPMAEAGGTATVKATLSETFSQPVSVYFSFAGTATLNTDYNPSETAITIPAGSLTNAITLTAVQDTIYEGNETIIVDISSVANGTESGTQQVTATITDDDPQLLISPSNSVTFRGSSGGVTSPSNQIYTLNNAGADTISWTAVSTNSWTVLSSSNGTLASGATTNVTLSINSTGLAVGDYAGSITFSDTTHSDSLPRTITLTVTPTYVYFFPLDTDPGWSRNGQWAFGQPTGLGGGSSTYGDGPDPSSGVTGTNVFGVNLNGNYSTTVGGPYYLTAGPFDFSGYTNVVLYFQRWLNTDYGAYVPSTVEVSSNGTAWTTNYFNEFNYEVSTNWSNCQYDISSVADRQATVYVRWGYQIKNSPTKGWSGWNIDDIGFTGDAIPSPDTDGDGIPNEWELQYFGGTTNANPDATAANGTNTVMEAYIAGLDPTDPEAVFNAGLSTGRIIQWNAVSGRVYAVLGTTNLLNSFQTLETNILFPQSSWTDTVHSTEGSSFYKVDVQLAP